MLGIEARSSRNYWRNAAALAKRLRSYSAERGATVRPWSGADWIASKRSVQRLAASGGKAAYARTDVKRREDRVQTSSD